MLYSYNGEYPTDIPERIRLSDGSTRTDSSTYTCLLYTSPSARDVEEGGMAG